MKPEEFARNVGGLIKTVVSKALEKIESQISDLRIRVDANSKLFTEVKSKVDALPSADELRGKDGVDGEVDYERVERMIGVALPTVANEAIAKHFEEHPIVIPDPIAGKDGEDAAPVDIKALVDELDPLVENRVSEAIANHFEEHPIVIPDPVPGHDGKDADPVDVKAVVQDVVNECAPIIDETIAKQVAIMAREAVKEVLDANPLPTADELRGKDGVDGEDGADADPVDVDAVVAQVVEAIAPKLADVVAAHFAANPIPEPAAGKDADPVTDQQLQAALGPAMEAFAAKWMALHPAKDGRDGRDAEMLTESMIDAAIARHMRENPVKDGRDGIDFTEMEAIYDGERTVTLRFARGDVVKEFPITINTIIYRGVYKHADSYAKGDMVTWDGSTWCAKRDTSKPPLSSDDWQLAVKKGTPGKDGKSFKGEPGAPGRNGRDLTLHSERGR